MMTCEELGRTILTRLMLSRHFATPVLSRTTYDKTKRSEHGRQLHEVCLETCQILGPKLTGAMPVNTGVPLALTFRIIRAITLALALTVSSNHQQRRHRVKERINRVSDIPPCIILYEIRCLRQQANTDEFMMVVELCRA